MKHLGKLFINKPDWKRDRIPHSNNSDRICYSPHPCLTRHSQKEEGNGQPIALLTKNQRLQGGVDPDVFFNQVCGR